MSPCHYQIAKKFEKVRMALGSRTTVCFKVVLAKWPKTVLNVTTIKRSVPMMQ